MHNFKIFFSYKHISKEVLWKINQKLCPLEEVTYKTSLKIISFQFTKMVREIYRKGCDSKAISSWVLKSPTKIAEIRTCILTGIWSLSTLSSQQQFRFREVPVPHLPISRWTLFLPPPPNLHMCVHSVQVTLSVGWCKAILPGQHWQTFQNQDKLGKKVIRGQLVFFGWESGWGRGRT